MLVAIFLSLLFMGIASYLAMLEDDALFSISGWLMSTAVNYHNSIIEHLEMWALIQRSGTRLQISSFIPEYIESEIFTRNYEVSCVFAHVHPHRWVFSKVLKAYRRVQITYQTAQA